MHDQQASIQGIIVMHPAGHDRIIAGVMLLWTTVRAIFVAAIHLPDSKTCGIAVMDLTFVVLWCHSSQDLRIMCIKERLHEKFSISTTR